MNKLKTTLLKLARENTGIAMCDSGGDSGRAWQIAQKQTDAEIFKEPKPETYGEETTQGKNTFNYLLEYLEVTVDSNLLDNAFKKYMKKQKDSYWLCDMEKFAEQYNEPDGYLCEETKTTNTYNYENDLTETLQYIIFHKLDKYYIILQIHRGADVRGGYTEPKIFELNDAESFLLNQTTEEREYN